MCVQTGRWQDLYVGMKHVFIGLGVIVVSFFLLAIMAASSGVGGAIIGGIAIFVGIIWLLIGLAYYRVYAFNYLTRHKVLDGEVTFDARMETGQVLRIFIVGSIIISVLMGVVFGVIGGVSVTMNEALLTGNIPLLIFIAALYMAAFLIAGGLSLVMITQPVIEHAVNNLHVYNADHLNTIQQRAADAGADAEGFADALDVGGAI